MLKTLSYEFRIFASLSILWRHIEASLSPKKNHKISLFPNYKKKPLFSVINFKPLYTPL